MQNDSNDMERDKGFSSAVMYQTENINQDVVVPISIYLDLFMHTHPNQNHIHNSFGNFVFECRLDPQYKQAGKLRAESWISRWVELFVGGLGCSWPSIITFCEHPPHGCYWDPAAILIIYINVLYKGLPTPSAHLMKGFEQYVQFDVTCPIWCNQTQWKCTLLLGLYERATAAGWGWGHGPSSFSSASRH